jgi:hypothetical protein
MMKFETVENIRDDQVEDLVKELLGNLDDLSNLRSLCSGQDAETDSIIHMVEPLTGILAMEAIKTTSHAAQG